MKKIALATLLALLIPTTAMAAEMEDVELYTCKDIMILDGSDREGAIAFLHGYLIGQSKSSTFDPDKKSEETDRFIDKCLDNPMKMAIEVLKASS